MQPVVPPTVKPTLAIAGALSFDSVLTPDGRYLVGKVGGNALWSALGAVIAGVAPRILTVVGTDYPSHVLPRLEAAGVDTSCVVRLEREHPVRLTFAHLADGGRIQPVPPELIAHLPAGIRAQFVDTTVTPEILRLGSPTGSEVPDAWLDDVDAWHLPLLPLERHRSLVERIRTGRGTLQSDCPARSDLLGDPIGRLAPTVGEFDTFLPSTSDFDVIASDRSVRRTLQQLRLSGAGTIVLKAGPAGAVVLDGLEAWHVPAFDAPPLDPTGAGDVFCGGFLVGMATTADPIGSAALGAATASFGVATENPLDLAAIDPQAVHERARGILTRVRRIDGSRIDEVVGSPHTARLGAPGDPSAPPLRRPSRRDGLLDTTQHQHDRDTRAAG